MTLDEFEKVLEGNDCNCPDVIGGVCPLTQESDFIEKLIKLAKSGREFYRHHSDEYYLADSADLQTFAETLKEVFGHG